MANLNRCLRPLTLIRLFLLFLETAKEAFMVARLDVVHTGLGACFCWSDWGRACSLGGMLVLGRGDAEEEGCVALTKKDLNHSFLELAV